ncbi:hypothetical protein LTR94_038374, partial [Friedmanniomyces endolithicus]
RQGAGRLPPPPDPQELRTLHHARTESLRGQGPVGARPRAGARKNPVRPAAWRPGAAHRLLADHRARAGPGRRA